MTAFRWTKTDVYDAEIRPLMDQIIAVCQREQIPLVAVFQIAVSVDDRFLYCSSLMTGPDDGTDTWTRHDRHFPHTSLHLVDLAAAHERSITVDAP